MTDFQDLLDASRQQEEPQRLLFTFTRIELPDGATAEQRQRTAAGTGRHLAPSMCVDKTPDELSDFTALVDESDATGQHWDVVFVAGMSGRAGHPPSSDEALQPLHMMVEAIKQGRVADFAAFDRKGQALRFL